MHPAMSDPHSPESLGASFRQSKRELLLMLGTWLVFALWITASGSLLAFRDPGENPATLFGMPSWVVYTVGLPWLIADVWIIFFALRLMKDTDLDAPSPDAHDA